MLSNGVKEKFGLPNSNQEKNLTLLKAAHLFDFCEVRILPLTCSFVMLITSADAV